MNGVDRGGPLRTRRGRSLLRPVTGDRMRRLVAAVALTVVALSPRAVSTAGAASPTIDQFLMPGTPIEIVAAKTAERIAWTAYEHGRRNVYTAAAPDFAPVRLTNVTKDDGIELSDISISRDGAIVVFVRGTQPNREGCVANPNANPAGANRTIWAARTTGGAAWKLGEGTTPALSPDGRTVAYAKDGQIYAYQVRLKPDTTGTPSSVVSGFSGTPHTPLV